MRKTNESRAPVSILLPAAAAGVLLTSLLLFAGAILVRRGTVGENMVRTWALAGMAAGCAVAAFIAAKSAPGGKFLWAAAAGLIVFLLLFAGSILLTRQPVHLIRSVISLLCAFTASALGGFAGATARKKKRYSHIKK